MTEFLAIPAWNTEGTTLDAWIKGLTEQFGSEVLLDRDPPRGVWLEIPAQHLRAYAMMAGAHVEAINFEVDDPEVGPVVALLEKAAASLAWEIHPDDDEDSEDDDEDDDD